MKYWMFAGRRFGTVLFILALLSPSSPVFCGEEESESLRLMNRSLEAHTAGRYDEALEAMLQYIELQEKGDPDRDPNYPASFSILAGIYREMGKMAEAEDAARHAATLREKLSGPNHPDVAGDLNQLGMALTGEGKHAEAEDVFQRAIRILDLPENAGNPKLSSVLNNLGLLYQSTGRLKQAEELFLRCFRMTESRKEASPHDLAIAYNNLAGVYRQQARHSEAEEYFAKALELNRAEFGEDHPATAQSMNNMAFQYFEEGRYAESEPLFKKAAEIYEKFLGSDNPELGTVLNNLAGFYTFAGQYAEAEALYRRSAAIQEKAMGPDHPDTALALNNLAALYRTTEHFQEALPLMERVLRINEASYGPEHPDVAQAMSNLAVLYDDLKEPDKAEPLFLRSLQIREKALGSSHPLVAAALNNLAAHYSGAGKREAALPLMLRALEIQKKVLGPEHPELVSMLSNVGALYAAAGRQGDARTYLVEAVRIQEKSRRSILSALSERQQLSLVQSQEPVLQSLLAHALQFGGKDSAATEDAFRAWLGWKGEVQEAQARHLDALVAGADPKIRDTWEQLVQARRELAGLYISGPGGMEGEDYRIQIGEKENRKEELEAALSRMSAVFAAENRAGEIGPAELRRMLPKDSAYVDFAEVYGYDFAANEWGKRRFAAFVLSRETPGVRLVDLGEAEPIEGQVKTYLAALRPENFRGVQAITPETARNSDTRTPRGLYDTLIGPLEEAIGSAKRLVLVPDGSLNLLPFEVVARPDGEALMDRYEISYLASGRDIARWSEGSISKNPAVVFADPDYDAGSADRSDRPPQAISRSLAGTSFARLPGTKQEGESLLKVFHGTLKHPAVLFTGAEATESNLMKLQSPRVLHLATHGYFLPDEKKEGQKSPDGTRAGDSLISMRRENPMVRSGIVLAGANDSLRGKRDEGIVTADKILGLNLLGTDLVVLSACETAVGDIQRGEGVFGLKRSFILAGARSMIMSLWQVSDDATQMLMTEFYKNWAVGLSKSEALRKARQTVRQKYPDPYYWGAFILIGNPK